jgi:hypothetical protein
MDVYQVELVHILDRAWFSSILAIPVNLHNTAISRHTVVVPVCKITVSCFITGMRQQRALMARYLTDITYFWFTVMEKAFPDTPNNKQKNDPPPSWFGALLMQSWFQDS